MKFKADQVKFRPMNPEADLNFILSAWLQSYKTSEFAHHIPKNVYYPHHQELISQILLKETNHTMVACDPIDSSLILGFITFSTKAPIIFYCYVKHSFRKFGLGSALMDHVLATVKVPESDFVMVTHKPKRWSSLTRRWKLVYNPYIVSGE